MDRKRYRLIFWSLAAIAVGVQVIWLLILLGLELQVPLIVTIVFVFFPGAMGWIMPVGFAYLWKDEITETHDEGDER